MTKETEQMTEEDDAPLTNAQRAEWAKQTIAAYNTIKEGDPDIFEPRDSVIDLVTDLLHFMQANGIGGEEVLAMARQHFEAEQQEETEQQGEGE